jgi:hypothetical protein
MARTKLLSKKAQMHMTETISVIFIFFVLVAFGITFYYYFQKSAIQEEQQKLVDAKLETLTLQVTRLPELTCTKAEAEPVDNCVDVLKMQHTGEIFKKYFSDYYFGMFSFAKIKVVELYPGNRTWTLYEQKRENNENVTFNYESTYFIVALRNQTNAQTETQYGFGYLEVGVYYETRE